MMLHIESISNFLSSIVPFSGLTFWILDNNGVVVFSTEDIKPIKISEKTIRIFFKKIMDQDCFQYSTINAFDFLCGIPIRKEQIALGALLAFGRVSCTSARHETLKCAEDDHAVEIERFLKSLAKILEKDANAQEEIDEMAQELDQRFEDLYLYGEIASQIRTVRFSPSILGSLIEKLMENMRADAAFAIFPDRPEFNTWFARQNVFESIKSPDKLSKKLIELIPADSVSLREKFFIVNDSRENSQYKTIFMNPYRFLAVEVKHQEDIYGWLGLVSFNLKEIFRQGELKLLVSLAEQVSGAITNTELYNDLEQFIINMVKSLVFAIEAKDIYTRGHSERVSHYSKLIGKRLGLNGKDYNDLKWASILHDIGKIGIPERILNKPDRLTDAEYDVIKGHPVKGGEILKPVEQLAGSLPGIIHHHERYDGLGYPGGLKGEDIPFNARIIAVADTFDAINSSRAYRESNTAEKAMAIIEEVAGSQLDPKIVDVFKKVYQEDISQ